MMTSRKSILCDNYSDIGEENLLQHTNNKQLAIRNRRIESENYEQRGHGHKSVDLGGQDRDRPGNLSNCSRFDPTSMVSNLDFRVLRNKL